MHIRFEFRENSSDSLWVDGKEIPLEDGDMVMDDIFPFLEQLGATVEAFYQEDYQGALRKYYPEESHGASELLLERVT
jgi:trans-aconitate methyltransferase